MKSFNEIKAFAVKELELLKERMEIGLVSAVESNMRLAGTSQQSTPNNSNKLRFFFKAKKEGNNLISSFVEGNKDSLTKFVITDKGVSGIFGSKKEYANIHDKGGFVKSKGKMERFFWAKYIETQMSKWKYLALAVKRDGGVKIPPRPYFSESIEDFDKNKDKIIELFLNRLIKFAYE